MNVLIVGLGSIAKKHISVLRKISPDISITALRQAVYSHEYEDIKSIYDLNFIEEKFDFAIISNPTYLHYSTILSLIPLNIPLFIEKPSLMSLENSDNLIEILFRNKINTYVACNMRFLDCLKFVKAEILKTCNVVNEVNVYCGSYLPEWRQNVDFRKNYSAIPELGGGVHLDLIHEFDYLYWIFGMPIQTRRVLRNKSSLNIAAIDYANYILEYDSMVANVVLNYYRRDYKRTFEIVFDTKTWLVNIYENSVYENGIEIFSSQQKNIDTYYFQMSYFLEKIQKKEDLINSFAESINVLKICLSNE